MSRERERERKGGRKNSTMENYETLNQPIAKIAMKLQLSMTGYAEITLDKSFFHDSLKRSNLEFLCPF